MNLYDILLAKKLGGGSAPTPTPVLISKNITANGVYNAADDDADGYSSVDVQVPAPPSSSDLSGNVTTTGTIATGLGDISLNIPNSVTEIGQNAFYNKNYIASITIPSGVTTIGQSAFQNCTSLTSITIPNSVTSIGGGVFQNCTSLTSITIPSGVTIIEDTTFYNCTALTSITIPNSVTSIGGGVFRSCTSLTSITIPSGVTIIGQSAFHTCTALTNITIPSGVTTIRSSAFQNCTALTSIICEATNPPTIASSTFTSVPADCAIYVPADSVDAYKVASYWNTRAAYIQAIPG